MHLKTNKLFFDIILGVRGKIMKENLKKLFLKYVSYDTQSDDSSSSAPSTIKQLLLGKVLLQELKNLGIDNAFLDEYGYVYGYIPSNVDSNLTIGLIAHQDTALEMSGANITPQIIENYQGETITLKNNVILNPDSFPSLKKQIGHELITTDGTTLLGGDDKAGIAIIMEAIIEILKNDYAHPNIIVTFTPDEEIGRGTEYFNYAYYQQYNCSFAYTIDGGNINEINFENFNACSAKVVIKGSSIHPGSAKGKLVNSLQIAMEFHQMLPKYLVPELTENYEGFNHLLELTGSCNETVMNYLIRNHDSEEFEKQKSLFKEIENFLNLKYANSVNVTLTDSYYNMRNIILEHNEVLQFPIKAMNRLKLNPSFVPIRGGTDGAHLTFNGIYTPNLGTGGYNCHGAYEYVDVDEMEMMVKVIIEMLKIIVE